MPASARRAPFLSVLRELAQCYQAFERYSSAHIHSLDLTPPQFDVIATLGNTEGMTFRELGMHTLITKGTLTGVVDRLEAKGLVVRAACPHDARSTLVTLTPAGEQVFAHAFPSHVAHLQCAFGRLRQAELSGLGNSLRMLREALDAAAGDRKGGS